ncbi:hypothetical protein A7A09_008820 [Paracoccus methylarcula]|uniref:Uncharacterized protein n=1 Tax=Paracoccus methylarcula TaxID=72022 RepID=A0A422QYJ4_9RHOB|nr:hypothetical protein A7A09_008820 [Paracoccus methylarcula]
MGRPRATFTKTDIKRAVQGAREADPNSVIELVLGSVTVRLVPNERIVDQVNEPDKFGLPKQW